VCRLRCCFSPDIQVAVLDDNAAALGRLVPLQLANIRDHVFHAPSRRVHVSRAREW